MSGSTTGRSRARVVDEKSMRRGAATSPRYVCARRRSIRPRAYSAPCLYMFVYIYIDKLMNKARGDRIYVTPRSVCVYIGPMQGRCREVVFAFLKVDISARPDGSLHFYEGASIYRAITRCGTGRKNGIAVLKGCDVVVEKYVYVSRVWILR